MFLTNYNYGIKLIDLIDYNGDGTFDELLKQVNDLLTSNCKDEFFCLDDNDILWNDFVKRFTRRFCFRTLSFDTYLNFCIKLCDVFTKNKVKLQRMYETKMIEFNPLYNKNLKTDTQNLGTSQGKQKTNRNDKRLEQMVKDGSSNYKDEGKENIYNLHSDTPRSAVKIGNLFKDYETNDDDTNYITDAQNQRSGRATGGTKGYNDNTNSNSNIQIDGVTVNDFSNSTNGKMLFYGYDGYPVDLLRKYMKFVIDMNETLLEEIENNHLFMSIVV